MPSIVAVPAARLAPVRGPKPAARPRRVVPALPARRSASAPADARRGALAVARGKKKKGFAELMGGGDEDTVTVKKNAPASESERCPCGGGDDGLPYSRCCKPFHKGDAYPEDCVTLMRSRFSGYAKGEGEYVVATTHPENPIFQGQAAKAESGKVASTPRTTEDDVQEGALHDLEICHRQGE